MNFKLKMTAVAAGLMLFGAVQLFAQGRPAPMVPVGKAETISEQGTRMYIGKVESIHTVTLRMRVSGVLQKVFCKDGDFVKKGTLLMQIEDTLYKSQVDSALARVKQIQADLEYARTNYKRQEGLIGIAADSEMDEASRRLKLTEAQLLEAQAALTEAQTNLSYTRIYAPVDGRIGKITYSEGNYLTPSSDVLATIVTVSPIHVKMALSEPDYIKMFGSVESLKKDAVIRIRTADRKMFDEIGKVEFADNQIDPMTGTLMVWCTFENKSHRLIPGGIVDSFIGKKVKEQFPAIPISAVMTSKNGQNVYVVTEDSTAMIRPVELGEQVGDMQIILKGIQEGERVIVDGVHKVMPGAKVVAIPVKRENPAKDLSHVKPASERGGKIVAPAAPAK